MGVSPYIVHVNTLTIPSGQESYLQKFANDTNEGASHVLQLKTLDFSCGVMSFDLNDKVNREIGRQEKEVLRI